MNINNRDYDFPGMAGQVEAWCNKNQIARKTTGRIQLAFEETTQMLVTMLDDPRIRAVCEYAEATESAEWTISYSGKQFDVTTAGDELVLALLNGITAEKKYDWNEGAKLPNQLKLRIQNG